MTIFLGADHGGFQIKEALKPWLTLQGYTVVDCGNSTLDPQDDYPDFANVVARSVAKDTESRGILLCRSAGGMVIAANRVLGIRCVHGVAVQDVQFNREHDDINVLALSGDEGNIDQAKKLIDVFLATPFSREERHVRRLQKIDKNASQ